MNKLIYYFSKNDTDGDSTMSDTLGGKGANLAQMCKLGLPIPEGFTISTKLCNIDAVQQPELFNKFESELKFYIAKLEQDTEKKIGCNKNPLLLSVRSGSKVSMPGMMDTILNLGINDDVAEALAIKTQNPCFAYDSYRRFLEMYGSVAFNISSHLFEEILEEYKGNNNFNRDNELTEPILLKIIDDFKHIIHRQTGREFESDPYIQLTTAIRAVWRSWNCSRAIIYRKINNISNDIGTAVNIQSMVFGNKGNSSATGVIFTRDPSIGDKKIFGEYLINAQGEDVVSGIRTPYYISSNGVEDNKSMQKSMPEQYNELVNVSTKLETHFKDMQDIEFTIEESKLYILQTRSGKRSVAASIKIAVDMVKEGLISKEESLMSIDPESITQLLHTTIDYATNPKVIATGLPASPGANTGIAVFSPYDVEELCTHHNVILVRNDTTPEDIKGMHLAKAILTARGGMTSHAAVVARGMGRPCVCGVNGLAINEKKKLLTTSNGYIIKQGDTITVDGSTGKIIVGEINLIQPKLSKEFETILEWADEIKELKVRANAETANDSAVAIKFGASAIGLCRTEHMFFDSDKILIVREMIVANNIESREKAIKKLKPLQINDFKNIFKVMNGKSVNIRLLDPPLHEFLPVEEHDKKILSKTLGVPLSIIDNRLNSLHEHNPMLGHRGCRLGISYPEIYLMQIEAVLEAIKILKIEENIDSKLELMIPLVSEEQELSILKTLIEETIRTVELSSGMKFNIKLGTMIELPRAAIIADELAKHVEYFSFGSNDLTQTTYGISRDDIGSFLPDYIEKNIFNNDPFVKIDTKGVGELIKMAIDKGKKSNPDIIFGVCGEHAGNPESIDFFHMIGLDYISCSPYRIPVARLAAARSKIKLSKKEV